MGVYSEYLDRSMGFPELQEERKKQLRRIAELRSRDVLVYAANQSPQIALANVNIGIEYADLLPINDQLANLSGTKLDFILETPGGSGETAEDIVRLLHGKYEEVAVIVPGSAKSAGTIIAMAADEILMEPASALGPIDAQIGWQGKVFSAEALLEGMEKIKAEVVDTGILNKAYIPILQSLSPGELQNAQNALDFAKVLVKDWLIRYKFKNWTTHLKSGGPVTDEEKQQRAKEIADALGSHRRWLTHGRSIKIEDLEALGLKITDYSADPDLADVIRRYYTLLQMTFASNIYKVTETPDSQILRAAAPMVPLSGMGGVPHSQPLPAEAAVNAVFDYRCANCGTVTRVQANLDQPQPLQPGCVLFPLDNKFHCPNCGTEHELADTRRQIELQTKKRIVN